MTLKDLKNETKIKCTVKDRTSQPILTKKKNDCKLLNKKLWETHIEEVKTSNNKNLQSRNLLIRKYVYLVNWVVSRLPVTTLQGMDRDDLIGYGTIGLIEAVDRFDPGRNSSFESFAITRIRGSIYDQLRSSDWLTRGARKRVKNLFKVVTILEHRLGRHPNDKEIAEELSISLQELRTIQQEAQIGIFSLDEPRDHNSDEGNHLVDNISSGSVPFLDKLEESELKERLTKAIDSLPEKERTVVGLYHYKKLTFKEIAAVMEFSESRASQVHARAVSLLKAKMLKE